MSTEVSLPPAPDVWSIASPDLEIREESTVLAEDSLVSMIEPETWRQLGLLPVRTQDLPSGYWTIRAGRKVGMAQLQVAGTVLQVRIQPKLDNTNLFFLTDYAWGRSRDLLEQTGLKARIDVLQKDPAATLLAWYLGDLLSFVRRNFRRGFTLRQETFTGRVRGRILVHDYVRRSLTRSQDHRVPCQFVDFSADTLSNRLLRASLSRVRSLIPHVPIPEARSFLQNQANAIAPYFSGVTEISPRLADFDRLRLDSARQNYTDMMAKCRSIIEGVHVAMEVGSQIQTAFQWDMAQLFEQAVRQILAHGPFLHLDQARGNAVLFDKAGKPRSKTRVIPDLVIRRGSECLVADTKYKRTSPSGTVDENESLSVKEEGLSVPRQDIYQVISYGRHLSHLTERIGLIYPVVLDAGETLPGPFTIRGFTDEVTLFFIDIGAHARENVADFRAAIEDRLISDPGA